MESRSAATLGRHRPGTGNSGGLNEANIDGLANMTVHLWCQIDLFVGGVNLAVLPWVTESLQKSP